MTFWCDDTAAIWPLSQNCTPRVTSKYFPLPVSAAPATGAYANGGGALAAASIAQTGIPAGAMTHGGDLVNNGSNSETLCFSVGGTATLTNSYTNPCLAPGNSYHFAFPPGSTQAVSVVAATAGHTWSWVAY